MPKRITQTKRPKLNIEIAIRVSHRASGVPRIYKRNYWVLLIRKCRYSIHAVIGLADAPAQKVNLPMRASTTQGVWQA